MFLPLRERLSPTTIFGMANPTFDPGLTQQFTGAIQRTINKDGEFNVRRHTHWRDIHPYLHLINMSWPVFLAVVFVAYLSANIVFAFIYFELGPGALTDTTAATESARFLHAFFFSAQTLSTAGYGTITPNNTAANFVAVFEAMMGLMGFAVATGVLFGRVSKPSARIKFSERMLIAPYQTGTSIQFRIVNLRPNVLMELEAVVMLMTAEGAEGTVARAFKILKLERERIYFFPLTWTIVHPIDESSPLYGKSAEDLKSLQAEFLILIKGFDETFSQTVYARFSYRHDEIVWGARFGPAFHVDSGGGIVLDIERLSVYKRTES